MYNQDETAYLVGVAGLDGSALYESCIVGSGPWIDPVVAGDARLRARNERTGGDDLFVPFPASAAVSVTDTALYWC